MKDAFRSEFCTYIENECEDKRARAHACIRLRARPCQRANGRQRREGGVTEKESERVSARARESGRASKKERERESETSTRERESDRLENPGGSKQTDRHFFFEY